MIMSKDLSEEARKIHEESIVIDSLSDGAQVLTEEIIAKADKLVDLGYAGMTVWNEVKRMMIEGVTTKNELKQMYLKNWNKSGVTAVSSTQGALAKSPFSYQAALEDLALMQRLFDRLDGSVVKLTRADDIRQAKKEGKPGIILNFQNASPLEDDISRLDLFYNLGVRIIQLTYNLRNLLGDGCTERKQTGLSSFGVGVVERMNNLGMLIDLSHCGDQTSMDAIGVSKDPVAFTHTGARKLYNHPRLKEDELLKAIAEKGGYVGVLWIPCLLSSKPEITADYVVDHVEYIANLIGVGHVGIGTDWFIGFGRTVSDKFIGLLSQDFYTIGFKPEHRVDLAGTPKGIRDYGDWIMLTEGLLRRGFSKEEVRKIIGGNFHDLFERVVG